MPIMRRLAVLATVAEAARRYARSNPDQAAKYLDQAAAFVDKQTKGKYSQQIRGAADKVKGAAGIRPQHDQGFGATGGNGYGAAPGSGPGPENGYGPTQQFRTPPQGQQPGGPQRP